MSIIKNIAIHHSGGLGSNARASTLHLTIKDINAGHRLRWSYFPSKYLKQPDGQPWHVGYNAVYDPKTRVFTQTRALGEETAAQIGYNLDTFSLCIIGNYSMGVDPMTEVIRNDVVRFLEDLMDGNKRGLVVAPGTDVLLSVAVPRPHRFYQQTECYGSGLPDRLFQDLIIERLAKKLSLYQLLLKLVAQLDAARVKVGGALLGSSSGLGCEGFISLENNDGK